MNRNAMRVSAGMMALLAATTARGQMAVVDVQSLFQLQQQIQYWQQQIDGMSNQITTLRAQLQSTTGTRGMGNLLSLSDAQRNYLPTTASQLLAVTAGPQAMPSDLRTAYTQFIARQAALPTNLAATLSLNERTTINDRRSAVATRASAMQVAMSAASARFAQLQSLIDEINKTTDPKGIQDLQGRIAAEQVMALNEVAKLNAVTGWADSNIDAVRTHSAEAALSAHGLFSTRFQPAIN